MVTMGYIWLQWIAYGYRGLWLQMVNYGYITLDMVTEGTSGYTRLYMFTAGYIWLHHVT